MDRLVIIVERIENRDLFMASDPVTARYGVGDTAAEAIRAYADQFEDFRAELDVPDDELGFWMLSMKHELKELGQTAQQS